MKTTTQKTENVMGKDLRVGDVVVRGGYEWVIDQVTFEPDFPRYVCLCHWSGNGLVNPQPHRLACRTDAPAWYATQVGRQVELRRPGTDEVQATIEPPAAWGDAWGWNLIAGGVVVEHTAR